MVEMDDHNVSLTDMVRKCPRAGESVTMGIRPSRLDISIMNLQEATRESYNIMRSEGTVGGDERSSRCSRADTWREQALLAMETGKIRSHS